MVLDMMIDEAKKKLAKLLEDKTLSSAEFMAQVQLLTCGMLVTMAYLTKDMTILSGYLENERTILYEGYHMLGNQDELDEQLADLLGSNNIIQ